MATQAQDSEKFTRTCIELSWYTTAYKLKQLKFLLQDAIPDVDISDQSNKSFLDLVRKLEGQAILNRHQPGRNEALLLYEMFEAISLPACANKICSEFKVKKGMKFRASDQSTPVFLSGYFIIFFKQVRSKSSATIT